MPFLTAKRQQIGILIFCYAFTLTKALVDHGVLLRELQRAYYLWRCKKAIYQVALRVAFYGILREVTLNFRGRFARHSWQILV